MIKRITGFKRVRKKRRKLKKLLALYSRVGVDQGDFWWMDQGKFRFDGPKRGGDEGASDGSGGEEEVRVDSNKRFMSLKEVEVIEKVLAGVKQWRGHQSDQISQWVSSHEEEAVQIAWVGDRTSKGLGYKIGSKMI